MSEGKLVSIRNELLGTNWRCMTPMGKEREGVVVQVNDVMQNGNQIFVSFDSGSKISYNIMRDHFIRAEESIDMGGSGAKFEQLNEYDPYAGITGTAPSQFMPSASQTQPSAMPTPPPGVSLLDMPMKGGGPINIQAMMGEKYEPTATATKEPAARIVTPVIKAESIFKMFDTKRKELPVKIQLDFPDIQLLKLMHKNAADKGKFMDELSTYVYSNINKDAVIDAMTILITGAQKTKGDNDSRVHDQEPSDR